MPAEGSRWPNRRRFGAGKTGLTAPTGSLMIPRRPAAAAGTGAKGRPATPIVADGREGTWTPAPEPAGRFAKAWGYRPMHERGEREMDDGACRARPLPLLTAPSQVTRQGPL